MALRCFDGNIDGLDYIFVDNGFLNGLTGWANGDVNYDNSVDGLDYVFIDNAYLGANGTLARGVHVAESFMPGAGGMIDPASLSEDEQLIWNHAHEFGEQYVTGFLARAGLVPEPATGISVGAMLSCGLLRRCRRRYWRRRLET